MSDEELLEQISSVDLEAKEQHLRLLNEKLDQRRDEIVERAEKLLKKQKTFLKTCVEDNVKQFKKDCDSEIESTSLDDIIHSTENISPNDTKNDAAESMSESEELPRTLIPKKLTRSGSASRPSSKKRVQSRNNKQRESHVLESKTPDINDLEMESEILGGTTIGKDAELRLQRARYKALEKSFRDIVDTANDKEKEINSKNKIIRELQLKLKKYEKENENWHQKIKNEKKDSSELIRKCKRLEHELFTTKDEIKNFQKANKSSKDSMRTNHIRLNRALEDAEKYKQLLQKYKNEKKNNNEIYNKDMINLKNENRILIKQKNELLSAFKKQLKLIDILKKQKIHLEAAKVLQFTEKQFIKTLDIGHNLNTKK